MRFKNKVLSIVSQLAIPLVALGLLLLFNLIFNTKFFNIEIRTNSFGNAVLSGNLINAISDASELAIIAMGMTLVTSACGGQDISVGAVGTISCAVFAQTLLVWCGGVINGWTFVLAILLCVLTAVVFELFNGALVAVFKIQPMIATLILYSCGRNIAHLINSTAQLQLSGSIMDALKTTIPGVPIPTAIFWVVGMGILMLLLFRFTNIRLYTQSVGINQSAARLNGINHTMIKLLSFVVLGVCVGIASIINVSRTGTLAHDTLLVDIEMDAILAVAIGGNSLGGGKFRLSGSILGAYVIQVLNTTLNALIKNNPASVKAIKAVVIILIVIAGSTVVRSALSRLWNMIRRPVVPMRKEVG